MLLKKELTEYNRYQAFAVHMAISLVIFFILLVCITQYWYPGILFDTGNGWKAIGMIVGIDLVLGPLLTLIVFNHNKSSLKFDLAIIALVQTAALAYGTWTIHQTRPVALAFVHKSFITLYADSVLGQALGNTTNAIPKDATLFYVFNDRDSTDNLLAERFESYSTHKSEVPLIKSQHYIQQADKTILISIDPFITKSRFIRIDQKSGKIIGFDKNED